ncbi:TetR/AcrR family transcriptional regulator [Pusillimonas sp.]|uniref:TetR/AcrR family transcriptional regulator n=1 Tax=Pusillimonas sp. TaxID=3040095 RepID=UPI0037C86FC1
MTNSASSRAFAPSDNSVRPKIDGRKRRSNEKRIAVLQAAAEVFKEEGFVGASMDVIAARAEVSKPTVYRYFDTKEQLFDAILDDVANRVLVAAPDASDSESVHIDLCALAKHAAAVILSENLIALQRLAIAEFTRFPSLTKRFYEHGPKKVIAGFKSVIAAQARQGLLEIDNLDVATSRFWGLTLGMPHRTKLIDPNWNMSEDEVEHWIDEGVAAFIRLYSRDRNSEIEN